MKPYAFIQCVCPMRGEYIQHNGLCAIVRDRRKAIRRFYFGERTAEHNPGIRRLSRLARAWAWLIGVFARKDAA